jgi:aryl-alcohol dehydrogenase-like predicted oxidoreductase
LTGKYRHNLPWPDSARAEGIRKRYDNERSWASLEALEQIGQVRDKTIAQMALAWQLSQPVITSPIIGANSVEQLDDSLGAVGVRLSADEMAALDEVSAWE